MCYPLDEFTGASQVSEWISVKDRLPDKNAWKIYAVLTDSEELRKYQVAWFNNSDKTFRLQEFPNNPIKVTHWMSLPVPPK